PRRRLRSASPISPTRPRRPRLPPRRRPGSSGAMWPGRSCSPPSSACCGSCSGEPARPPRARGSSVLTPCPPLPSGEGELTTYPLSGTERGSGGEDGSPLPSLPPRIEGEIGADVHAPDAHRDGAAGRIRAGGPRGGTAGPAHRLAAARPGGGTDPLDGGRHRGRGPARTGRAVVFDAGAVLGRRSGRAAG